MGQWFFGVGFFFFSFPFFFLCVWVTFWRTKGGKIDHNEVVDEGRMAEVARWIVNSYMDGWEEEEEVKEEGFDGVSTFSFLLFIDSRIICFKLAGHSLPLRTYSGIYRTFEQGAAALYCPLFHFWGVIEEPRYWIPQSTLMDWFCWLAFFFLLPYFMSFLILLELFVPGVSVRSPTFQ